MLETFNETVLADFPIVIYKVLSRLYLPVDFDQASLILDRVSSHKK